MELATKVAVELARESSVITELDAGMVSVGLGEKVRAGVAITIV